MGSETDHSIMSKASDLLSLLDVPFEETVVSAHRTPERLREYVCKSKTRI
jgi:phosphoribosylcarboxyaminoimidazole (NCAIR) mutase